MSFAALTGAARRAVLGRPVTGVQLARSLASTKFVVPATDPFPDVKYEPEVFFGDLPPTQEELRLYKQYVALAQEKKRRCQTEAYEIDFDAMREKCKDPKRLFPTVEDIDRFEAFAKKRPLLTDDIEKGKWEKIDAAFQKMCEQDAADQKDYEQKLEALNSALEKDRKTGEALNARLMDITYNELAEMFPEAAPKVRADFLNPEEVPEVSVRDMLYEKVSASLADLGAAENFTKEQFDEYYGVLDGKMTEASDKLTAEMTEKSREESEKKQLDQYEV